MKPANEATRQFIRQHQDDDIRVLALKGTKDPEVDLAFALQQIDRCGGYTIPSTAAQEGNFSCALLCPSIC